MKFSEMPYVRPDEKAYAANLASLTERIADAASAADVIAAVQEYETISADFGTAGSIAHVRHTIDTRDKFYDAEHDFFDDVRPGLEEYGQNLIMALYSSKFRPELEEKYGALLFKNIEIQLKTFSPAIIEDLQTESKLVTEYQKLIASASFEFDGKTMNLAGLGPYKMSPDPEVRRSAVFADGEWYAAQSEQLDRIFDDLVKVRTAMAKKLGLQSFTQLAYLRMGRNCYTPADVDVYRAGIREDIVPISVELRKMQAKRIGESYNGIKYWDLSYGYAGGNPKPVGSYQDTMNAGRRMYHEMSPETTEFIDVMFDNELFDLIAKPGKAVGGYCTDFPKYKVPFIFSNFNGTSGDVDVLTHEAGHAYASYRTRNFELPENAQPTMEACETHSMSMEYLAWPWFALYYGDEKADAARFLHLEDNIYFLPYGTMVDHFQHIMYDKPELTPAQRNEVWAELETAYRPYIDFADTPFYSAGRGWQRQLHIYHYPFYYIDYCLAQTTALDVWRLSQQDYADAWKRYNRFVDMGGLKTYRDLCGASGLCDPMKPGALKGIADCAGDWLKKAKI